ncbi:aminoglycoside adenylyltransferase domain-containing protein [Streptomyces sp. NPDC059851]|uniref:aminoglycoside adenylyltransferase domain-containing protein n=1 Tax=Streptomyces sp. NPDC059851 TaxID=3346971 RepID=UPI00365BE57F
MTSNLPGRTPASALHPSAEAVVRTFLDTVDGLRPDLVQGLYLTGSVALGDFRPGRSDVDFVAVCAWRPGQDDVAALEEAHRQTRARHERPHFDGIHVTRDDLAGPPDACPPVPYAYEGSFHTAGDFEVNPVTWAVLARNAVAVRGPAPGTFPVGVDRTALTDWARANLDGYWRRWHAAHGGAFSPMGVAALGGWAPAWAVLGVSRLHYTVATGAITSKAGAGSYALQAFGAHWEPIVSEALRVHRGDPGPARVRSPFRRRADTLGFVSMVIEDCLR